MTAAARQHAELMLLHQAISHRFDREAALAERVAQAGAQVSRVSENVAVASDASQIHSLWMQSAGHRANLLDPQVNRVGIAVVERQGQYFAVEDFAQVVPSLSFEAQEQAVSILLAQAGMQMLPTTTAARETCSATQGFHGLQPSYVMRYTASSLSSLPPELSARLATQRYRRAMVAACNIGDGSPFLHYSLAVLLWP